MIKAPIVILAGGRSVRMGQDKAEIDLNGYRMIDIVIEKASKQSEKIYLSASQDYGTKLQVFPDLQDGPMGPVAALYSAMHWLENNTTEIGFVSIPVDAPVLPSDLVLKLFHPSESRHAVGPIMSHPVFAWWRIEDLKKAFTSIDLRQSIGLHQLAESIGSRKVKWPSEQAFVNINTPNDAREYLTDTRSKNIGRKT